MTAPRSRRAESALAAGAIAVLVVALVVPWWSESATLGPIRQTDILSPWYGLTVSCTGSCGSTALSPGPGFGTHSFEAANLSATGLLYRTTLGLALVGLGSAAWALVQLRVRPDGGSTRRRRTFAEVPAVLSATATALGAAVLPVLQPFTLQQDLSGHYYSGNAWTAAPSPETTFWGSCSSASYDGVCASHASVAWGPGLGWLLLVGAAVLLSVALALRIRRARGGPLVA